MQQIASSSAPVSLRYKTVFEKFLFPAAFIALLGFILSLVNVLWVSGYLGSFGRLSLLISFLCLISCILLMLGFSSDYEFDTENRIVWLKIKLFNRAKRLKIAVFDEIGTFFVTGIQNRARVHIWWTYKVIMLLKSGKMLPVSDAAEKSVFAANRLAERLAGKTASLVFPAGSEKRAHVAIAGNQPIIEFRDWNFADFVAEFWLDTLLSLLFFAAIVLFIVAMVVQLS